MCVYNYDTSPYTTVTRFLSFFTKKNAFFPILYKLDKLDKLNKLNKLNKLEKLDEVETLLRLELSHYTRFYVIRDILLYQFYYDLINPTVLVS